MVRMRLNILMAEQEITQTELAEETGIRQATISAYVNNTFKTINKKHIDILCDFFECEIEDLLTRKKVRKIKLKKIFKQKD